MIRSVLISLMVLLTIATAAHSATVRAVVDRNRIFVGETVYLQIIIDDGQGTVDISGVTAFTVSPRGTSSNFQMTNGSTFRQVIHNYTLVPRESGELTLPAIPVTIDGTVHYTTPIVIMVSEEDAADSGQRDVYVTASVSSPTIWLGQTVTYTFRLFNAVQIAEARFQPPNFSGFLAEEREDRKSYRTTVNGREFIVTEIMFILIPSAAGTLTIEPAALQVGIVSQVRRAKPFSGMDAFFGQNEMLTRILKSEAISVEVRNLPEPPPGTHFSGLVGEFEISAVLDKTEVQAGDSATLTVTIQGHGNIMDAPAPAIPVTSVFKAYADTPETHVQKNENGYSGRKIFRTALVPVTPGDYRIDPVTLAWFDVKTRTYRHTATTAIDIRVTPSDTAADRTDPVNAPADTPPSPKKQVEFTGRDIFPLKTGPEVLTLRKPLPFTGFLLLMALPVLVFFVIGFILKQVRKGDTPARIMEKRTRLALKQAGHPKTPDAEFLSALYRAMVSAIYGRKGMVGTALTWTEVRRHLMELGWTTEDAASAAKLVETVESFNYSGRVLNSEKRRALFEQTRQVVRRLMR